MLKAKYPCFDYFRSSEFQTQFRTSAPLLTVVVIGLVLTLILGGIGVIIGGILVPLMIILQNRDVFKRQLKQVDGPKLQRPIYLINELFAADGNTLNASAEFFIPKRSVLQKNAYLILGQGHAAQLYYIGSKRLARKIEISDLEAWHVFLENLLLAYPNQNFIDPNQQFDEFILIKVLPETLVEKTDIMKKVITGLSIFLVIASLILAFPIIGFPLATVLIVAGIVLGFIVLFRVVMQWTKKNMMQKMVDNPPSSLDKDES